MDKDFLSNISTFDYVSFDVFDTLLFRTTSHYKDVFDLVELTYNKKYSDALRNFKKVRVLAEAKARANQNGREVTLDMIYSYLPYDNQKLKLLKKIELDSEIRNCVPNQCMIDLLNDCKSKGKKIVITSDMYLPRIYFLTVFKKFGISFDYLFISGEEGVTKRTGKLFQVVLDKLKISPSKIVHIGDDLNNDIEQPEKYGIKAYERLLPKPLVLPYSHEEKENQIAVLFANFLQIELNNHGVVDSSFIIGYTVIGPLLWEFCQWLHKQKNERGLDRLLFVAREGFLIKKCYELIYPDETESIAYVRINKNLLRFPMLDSDKALENFIMSIPPRRSLKWYDILAYLYIEDLDETMAHLQKVFPNTDFSSPVEFNLMQQGAYEKELSYLLKCQKNIIMAQKRMLLSYLEKIGILKYRIGIVNNSINGSGQKLIEDFLQKNHLNSNILGLQFVKSDLCVKRLGDRCAAWLHSVNIPGWKKMRFVSQSLIFEHLLFEAQGTARCFQSSNDNHVEPVCEKQRTEVNNNDKIATLQKYACMFVNEYKQNMGIYLQGLGVERYLSFLLSPTREDALFVGSLWDDDVEEDRQLLNLTASFRPRNCLLQDLPSNTGWFEGWLAVNNVKSFYKKVAHIRMLVRYYKSCLTKYLKSFTRL